MSIQAITRHIVLGFLLVLLTAALQCAPAQAASPAQLTLETSINRILGSIKNPDYVNPATRGPLRQQIEDEVLHIFDFKEFSSRTVGPRWSTFSPKQQQQFSDAFAELLMPAALRPSTAAKQRCRPRLPTARTPRPAGLPTRSSLPFHAAQLSHMVRCWDLLALKYCLCYKLFLESP